MTDQEELADRLVALGIVEKADNPCNGVPGYVFIDGDTYVWRASNNLINDWRIAGAVMELILKRGWSIDITASLIYVLDGSDSMADKIGTAVVDNGTCHAIIKAGADALEGGE